MIVSLDPDSPEVWYMYEIIDILRQGGVIAYPTDTVYALAGDLFSKDAMEKIYQIKKMPRRKPLSIICSDFKDISEFAQVSNTAYRLMKRLLPGPYTFILTATHKVPRLMLSKQRTIGIRVPDNRIAREIANMLGNPLISTSFQLDPEELVSDPFEIYDKYKNQLDVVVDGGPMPSSTSTVLDLTGSVPVLLREGKGSVEMLEVGFRG